MIYWSITYWNGSRNLSQRDQDTRVWATRSLYASLTWRVPTLSLPSMPLWSGGCYHHLSNYRNSRRKKDIAARAGCRSYGSFFFFEQNIFYYFTFLWWNFIRVWNQTSSSFQTFSIIWLRIVNRIFVKNKWIENGSNSSEERKKENDDGIYASIDPDFVEGIITSTMWRRRYRMATSISSTRHGGRFV